MIPTQRFVLRHCALFLLFALLAPRPASGWQAPPSPRDVLGWDLGERFTDVHQIHRYFEALAEASERVSVHEYGESWEGRPLIQVLVASAAHRARLDEILAANRELTDPATSPARANEIIGRNPAVVYLSYGVHGNESSSSEAAMWTAWDLAADRPEVAGALDSVIVVIDPILNPDGRERYVQFYRSVRGLEPNPDPRAREHREPWPGGRTNHYYFDLNRDWTWMSQAETRSRLATWSRWNPQVHVDFHEMGWRSTYFFFPAAEPINPIYPESTLTWGRRFGEANARRFDREGWLYFTGESYDHFYPGYGDTWPSLTGAIGMTYEQAGGGFAGLAVERPDGSLLTLSDRASHHRASGQATIGVAAERRTELLQDYAAFHRTVDEGHPDFLLVPGEETGPVEALVTLLLDQGVAVERATEAFGASARPHLGWSPRERFPAGTYRVRARQPRGRLAVTLLQQETLLDATYSYDISAWSLPYGFGVEAHATSGSVAAGWEPVAAPPTGRSAGVGGPAGTGDARAGYLVRPGFDRWPGLVRLLQDDVRVRVMADSFRVSGSAYPAGTFYLPRLGDSDLEERIERAGMASWAEPVATGFTEYGPDLGTGDAADLTLPSVMLLSGEGTSSGSMGAHAYFLEHRLGLPFDAVDVSDVAGTDLADYDVIVAPAASGLGRVLGDSGRDALVAWVEDGGTLVAVADAAFEVGRWFEVDARDDEDVAADADEADVERALRTREQRDLERWERQTPGTVLQVLLDPGHPLSFGAAAGGTPGAHWVLSTGRAFEPSEAFESVAHFPDQVDKVSGVIGEATLDRLRQSTWLVRRSARSGRVVLFADDPLYRMMWYSGFQPFTNALLLTPAF